MYTLSCNKSYIIFICNHDPYGRGRVVYRFENRCIEEPELPFGDETVKVIVNTRGTEGTVNAKLLEVIRYLDNGTVSGDFSRDLEDAVNHVKSSEERRHEYMIMMLREQELLEKGREQGREEGREQGIFEGVQKGEARLARLIGHLFSLGRDQDAVRAAGDPEYRRQLYSELGL